MNVCRLGRFALVVFCLGMTACSSTDEIAMEPSAVVQQDVFVAKGLTEDHRWVGVSEPFDPETDDRVVIVARLLKEDQEKILLYELVNPMGNVAWSDTRYYPPQKVLGVYVDIPTLIDRGGEGKWQANVYADGVAIGQANFVLGHDVEEMEDTGPRYHVVGAFPEDEPTEEERLREMEGQYDSYIQEATPELDIPVPPVGRYPQESFTDDLPPDSVVKPLSSPEPIEASPLSDEQPDDLPPDQEITE